jgi:hypothetical protein
LDYWKENGRERFVILGDFNDTPGDDSLNILESGDPVGGRSEQDVGEYLVNLMQPFYESDYVTQGVFRQYRGGAVKPIVRGASEDNDRLRGIDYQFPTDVRVTEALFDQILLTHDLHRLVGRVGIYSGENALKGKASDVTRNKDGEAYVRRYGDLPSDHLPVFADLRFGD